MTRHRLRVCLRENLRIGPIGLRDSALRPIGYEDVSGQVMVYLKEVQLVFLRTFRAYCSDKYACRCQTDWSILCINVGTLMLYPSISLDIRVLLLKLGHAKYHIVLGDFSDDEVYHMASLCSGAISQAYHLPYDGGSTQKLAIDCGNRRRLLLPCRLQAKTIHYSVGDKVISGTQVNERQVGVVTLATRALL